MNLIEKLHHTFRDHLITAYHLDLQTASSCNFNLNVDETQQAFGDISTNAAMILAKQLKRKPLDIAHEIVNQFKHPAISKIESAGPGFLNIFLTLDAFKAIMHELMNEKEAFFKLSPISRYNINLEFVSANPTGPLHFGHGRGGIIGDVLCNVLRFLGHEVTKEFYINDAGAQMEKLALSFKARCLQAAGREAQVPEDGYQGEYLKDLAEQCLKEEGLALLEKPDSFFRDYAEQHMLAHIKKTLDEFGIQFDSWFSEKTLHAGGNNSLIAQTLDLLEKNGYLYEQEGAVWFKSTAFGDDKDRVVRKTSGELTYVAADVAYLKNKIDRGFNKLLMTLGHDHHSYVIRLHAVQKALGLGQYPFDIILYQLVKLKEGGNQVRMSKRAGKIVNLDDVIEEVGIDVARFFFLNRKADAQLEFDLDLALKKTEENPVYYVQYAYVRIKSILEKTTTQQGLATISATDIAHLGTEETLLIKKIISLKALLESISTHYQTHTLTYYVIELASLFHKYYSKNRVINMDNPATSRARLLLLLELKQTFELVLTLLGISQPEKM
jgi:arginyl-tRNA synthetase